MFTTGNYEGGFRMGAIASPIMSAQRETVTDDVWSSLDPSVYDQAATNAESVADVVDASVTEALRNGHYVDACRAQRKAQIARSDARRWRETAAKLRAGELPS